MLPIVQTKISLSESEISTAQQLIAELQSRIAAEQERIAQLTEDNAVADGLLQAAQAAKGKISDLEVLADIQAELMKLFGGDSPGDNDGNGNQPINPAPQPNNDGGTEVATKDEPQPHDDGSFDGLEADFDDMPRMSGTSVAIATQPDPSEVEGQNEPKASVVVANCKHREMKLLSRQF